jgi:hypothetical protein
MGIKRHFILNTGAAIFIGPAAFYKLVSSYEYYQKQGYFDITLRNLKMPEGGWRKRIVFLYQTMRKTVGNVAGNLRELRTQNPKADREYRDAVKWVNSNARLQTPPTEGR